MEYFLSEEFRPKIQRQVDYLEELLSAAPPATILNLACGTGSATTEFARRGYTVTGLDCTPAMLALARAIAARDGVSVTWMEGDMRQLTYESTFDFVLLRDVIFGICETDAEHQRILHGLARALKPGGRCLLEVYNKAFSQVHGVERRNFLYDAATDRFIAPPDIYLEGGVNVIHLYSEAELQQMLAQEGIAIITRDGYNWPGDPEPPSWQADFLVGEK